MGIVKRIHKPEDITEMAGRGAGAKGTGRGRPQTRGPPPPRETFNDVKARFDAAKKKGKGGGKAGSGPAKPPTPSTPPWAAAKAPSGQQEAGAVKAWVQKPGMTMPSGWKQSKYIRYHKKSGFKPFVVCQSKTCEGWEDQNPVTCWVQDLHRHPLCPGCKEPYPLVHQEWVDEYVEWKKDRYNKRQQRKADSRANKEASHESDDDGADDGAAVADSPPAPTGSKRRKSSSSKARSSSVPARGSVARAMDDQQNFDKLRLLVPARMDQAKVEKLQEIRKSLCTAPMYKVSNVGAIEKPKQPTAIVDGKSVTRDAMMEILQAQGTIEPQLTMILDMMGLRTVDNKPQEPQDMDSSHVRLKAISDNISHAKRELEAWQVEQDKILAAAKGASEAISEWEHVLDDEVEKLAGAFAHHEQLMQTFKDSLSDDQRTMEVQAMESLDTLRAEAVEVKEHIGQKRRRVNFDVDETRGGEIGKPDAMVTDKNPSASSDPNRAKD